MAKNALTDWSETAADNTDVGGIDLGEGTMTADKVNNALRETMAQVAKVLAGTDPVDDTFTLGDPADLTKRARFDCGDITTGTTRVLTLPNATDDLIGALEIPWRHIETQTASASATLDFDLPSGYRDFMVVVSHMVPATDDNAVLLRLSTDAGATFLSTFYEYASRSAVNTTDLSDGSTSASAIITNNRTSNNGIGNLSYEGASMVFYVLDPRTAGSLTTIQGSGSYINAAGRYVNIGSFGGTHLTSADHNALRLLFVTGNIASGKASLYGRV